MKTTWMARLWFQENDHTTKRMKTRDKLVQNIKEYICKLTTFVHLSAEDHKEQAASWL